MSSIKVIVNNCIIINLDSRPDLWYNLDPFRNKFISCGKKVKRISGVDYKKQTHVINYFLRINRLNMNGCGFRHKKEALIGELGCYMSHYKSWKYIVDNNLDSCIILEDGIDFLQNDYTELSIDPNLDILFINQEMTIDFNKNLTGYGTQGYIITQKGAKLLLDKCFILSLPIDLQIRSLCNTKEICYDVMNKPFVKRNNNRISSIDETITQQTSQLNLNDKQNTNNILQRLFSNFLEKNLNLDDYI